MEPGSAEVELVEEPVVSSGASGEPEQVESDESQHR